MLGMTFFSPKKGLKQPNDKSKRITQKDYRVHLNLIIHSTHEGLDEHRGKIAGNPRPNHQTFLNKNQIKYRTNSPFCHGIFRQIPIPA